MTAALGRLEFSDAGISLSGTGKRYFHREFVPWSDITAVTREDIGVGWFLITRMHIEIHTMARKYVIGTGLYSKKDLEAIDALLRRVPGAKL